MSYAEDALKFIKASKDTCWCRYDVDYNDLPENIIYAITQTDVCVIIHASDNIELILNLPDCWSIPDTTPFSDIDIFDTDVGHHFSELRAKSIENTSSETSLLFFKDRQFEFNCSILKIKSKYKIITTITEKTNEYRQQQVLQNLLREVSHRSKNMLAIVQSLANQTAKYSDSIESFLKKFQGRLHSMSRSQDLITSSDWRGASFYQLVTAQLNQYLEANDTLLTVEGEDIEFNPNEALHIGLGLHELIINSISYGALNSKQNNIKILLSHQLENGIENTTIEWLESFSAKKDPSTVGLISPPYYFGSKLLREVLPSAVGGHAEYKVDTNQIYYRLVFTQNHL